MGGGHPRGRSGPVKCPDRHHALRMSLQDAYFGVKKTIKVTLQTPCRDCMTACNACQGVGKITEMQRMGIFTQMSTRPCPTCQGKGLAAKPRTECKACGGKVNVVKEHTIELNIPPAVETGHMMRFDGLGEQALRENEVNGDLIIEVLVQPDAVFQRQGNDLEMECAITFAESVIGKNILVPHFKEHFNVDTSTFGILDPGRKYAIPGKGMNDRSNLFLKFKIQYPSRSLKAEERGRIREAFASAGIISH